MTNGKEEVVIQVIGYTGVGKTTIAQLITNALNYHAINTTFRDPDSTKGIDLSEPRIQRVRRNTKVRVEEIQAQRDGVESE